MDVKKYLALAPVAPAAFFVLDFHEVADWRVNSVHLRGMGPQIFMSDAMVFAEYIVGAMVNVS
jgi:hypothetical protein